MKSIFKIIDKGCNDEVIGYSVDKKRAIQMATESIKDANAFNFSTSIEVHEMPTDELYKGGVWWDTLRYKAWTYV